MTVEVLTQGHLEDRTYKIECRACRSLLQFKRSDARLRWSPLGLSAIIRCPVCSTRIQYLENPFEARSTPA